MTALYYGKDGEIAKLKDELNRENNETCNICIEINKAKLESIRTALDKHVIPASNPRGLKCDPVLWGEIDDILGDGSNYHLERLNNPMPYLKDERFVVDDVSFDDGVLTITKKRKSDGQVFSSTFGKSLSSKSS